MFEKFKSLISLHWEFSLPNRTDIIIVDDEGISAVTEFLKPLKYSVMHTRGERLNFWIFLACLWRPTLVNYIATYINYVRPKLVVTLIDNNINYYRAIWGLPVNCIVVQNGIRVRDASFWEIKNSAISKNNIGIKLVLTFGEVWAKYYKEMLDCSCLPIGSFRNNNHQNNLYATRSDMLYVSQWQLCDNENMELMTPEIDSLILTPLHEYCETKDLRLQILLRSKTPSHAKREMNYFKGLIPGLEMNNFSSIDCDNYELIRSARLVAGVDSTLLLESLACGSKVAIFSVRRKMTGKYGFDFTDVFGDFGFAKFWTNEISEGVVGSIVASVDSLDCQSWARVCTSDVVKNTIELQQGNCGFQSQLEKYAIN